jgi:hypothetical protein
MGSGYKTFTAGAVLTASDVQNYLQDQSVMVFGGTAARSSAIGTANFEEGMLTYLTDVDKLQVYTGATFADVYPPATSNQGLTLINTTAFSGVSSQSINNVFTSTYDSYQIIFSTTAVATNGVVTMRLRASGVDTSTNYKNQQSFSASTSIASAGDDSGTDEWILTYINTATAKNNSFQGIFHRPNVAQPTLYNALAQYSTTSAGFVSGWQTDSTQFDGLTFIAPGNITGTISIYGFSK